MIRIKGGTLSELKYFYAKNYTGAVPRSSILSKFRQSSIRKEHVCFKYFVKKEKKKEKSCSEESL